MASFPNTNVRMFRGRSGANDRRLPKYEARRRKRPNDSQRACLDDSDLEEPTVAVDYSAIDQEDEENDEVVIVEPVVVAEVVEEPQQVPLVADSSPAGKEIKHLLKRIRNVSESISLSAAAVSNPNTWKNNVLNAVCNAVQEWRAISNHYAETLEDAQIKEPALAIYMLVQQAMQTGPLTCSTPGYFKRCGASVASVALSFLNEAVPDAIELRFTEKQAQAIAKWKLAATKAVASGNPPTKSQVKKQAGKGKK